MVPISIFSLVEGWRDPVPFKRVSIPFLPFPALRTLYI